MIQSVAVGTELTYLDSVSTRSVVLKVEYAPESPGGLLKIKLLGPIPRVSDYLGLGWGPRIFISHKLSDDADAAGQGTTLLRSTC